MSDSKSLEEIKKVLRSRRQDDCYEKYPDLLYKFAKWTQKQLRKSPYFLLDQGPSNRVPWRDSYGDENYYTLIYRDGDKVKVARFEDGMLGRYGAKVFGHITSESPVSLWQSHRGIIDTEVWQEMVAVLNGQSQLPEFDFLRIRVEGM